MFYIIFNPSGRIIQHMSILDDPTRALFVGQGLEVLESATKPTDKSYVVNGVLTEPSAAPSVNHVYNYDTRTWDFPLDTVIAAATQRIEMGRLAKNYAVIEYEGSNLDGDRTAQKNISDKILELDESIRLSITTPSELFIWRDADNIMHSFETITEFKDWLGGLTVALAQRGTLAYV